MGKLNGQAYEASRSVLICTGIQGSKGSRKMLDSLYLSESYTDQKEVEVPARESFFMVQLLGCHTDIWEVMG